MNTDQSVMGRDSSLPRKVSDQANEILELAQSALEQHNMRVAQALLRRALKFDFKSARAWELAYTHFGQPGEKIETFILRWKHTHFQEELLPTSEIRAIIDHIVVKPSLDPTRNPSTQGEDAPVIAQQPLPPLSRQEIPTLTEQAGADKDWAMPGADVDNPDYDPTEAQAEEKAFETIKILEARRDPSQHNSLGFGDALALIPMSALAGGYTLATTAVANFILGIITWCVVFSTSTVENPVAVILLFVFAITLIASIGSPILILIGGILAVAGGIVGLVAGIILGIVCTATYYLTSPVRSIRTIAIYATSIASSLALYHWAYNNFSLLQELFTMIDGILSWLHYANYFLCACLGFFVAYTFTCEGLPQPDVESENAEAASGDLTKLLAAPWKFYGRVAHWSNDRYEERQEEEKLKVELERAKASKAAISGLSAVDNWQVRQLEKQNREIEKRFREINKMK